MYVNRKVKLFLKGAIKIVHTASCPHFPNIMVLTTNGIYCTISPPLSDAMVDCSM